MSSEATSGACARTVVYTQRVEFGDCDPAGIVWFPNFFRWIDAASRHFFVQCGVPPWHEMEKTQGILGTPLVDTHSRFVKTASYGDTLHIEVSVSQWRNKSFVQRYRVLRPQLRPDGEATGGVASGHSSVDAAPMDLIMECEEVRIFAQRRTDGGNGIRAVPIPDSVRALCQ